MPKKGNNIYKRKDGRWEGRYQKGRDINGKILYGYVYATTFTEAKKLLIDKPKLTPKLPLKDPPVTTAPVVTLSSVAEQWLAMISLKVKPSTYANYESIVMWHIEDDLGKIELNKMTTNRICGYTKAKLEKGRIDKVGGLAPKTMRDILSVLKSIFDFAVSEKLISNAISIIYPKQKQRTIRVLNRSEQSALTEILFEKTDIYKMGMLLCLHTGLRVGEACALKWQDFSASFEKISVSRSMRRIKNYNGDCKTKIIIDTPKSRASIRQIPIPKFLAPMLSVFNGKADEYFISTPDAPLTEPRKMQYHFKRVIDVAKIAHTNFHSLRHTFSTRCIEAGVDIKSLSEILGHANVNITLNLYVHSSFEQKQTCMDKLEQYLGL